MLSTFIASSAQQNAQVNLREWPRETHERHNQQGR
jgi:hypothetical protein